MLASSEYGRRALSLEWLSAIAHALAVHPATLLLEDARLAMLLSRLLTDTDLQEQVHFFVTR
jgi:hypothetical protein